MKTFFGKPNLDSVAEKTLVISEPSTKRSNKWKRIILNILKVLGAIFFLYLFIFSIGLLSDAFQVLGGSWLNEVLNDIQRKLHH